MRRQRSAEYYRRGTFVSGFPIDRSFDDLVHGIAAAFVVRKIRGEKNLIFAQQRHFLSQHRVVRFRRDEYSAGFEIVVHILLEQPLAGRHAPPIEGRVMLQPARHVKDPFGAKLQKTDFHIRMAIEHAMADDGDESEIGRQGFADHVRVENIFAELGKGRIARSHMHAKRQFRASEFFPDRCETRMGEHAVAYGAVDDRRRGAEFLHFFDGFECLAASRSGKSAAHLSRSE